MYNFGPPPPLHSDKPHGLVASINNNNNMEKPGFIHKKNSRKVVVSKGSSKVWSKCTDSNFCMIFSVCVSASKYFAPPLLILPGKRLNRDVLGG